MKGYVTVRVKLPRDVYEKLKFISGRKGFYAFIVEAIRDRVEEEYNRRVEELKRAV